MAVTNVFIGADNIFTAFDDDLAIYGTLNGIETVKLLPESSGSIIDNKVDIVDLSELTGLKFKQGGNTLQVYADDGTTQLAKFPVQSDEDGTLVWLPGMDAPLTAKLTGTTMTIGDWVVPSDVPAEYGFGGSTVDVTGGNTTPYDASVSDVLFQIELGTYTYSISGFGSGDVLDFPDGNTVSVENTDWNDDAVDLTFALSGAVVTVQLVGLAAGLDAQLNSVADFDTVFGVGTIV